MAKGKNKQEVAVTLDPIVVEIQEKMKDPKYFGAVFTEDEVTFTKDEANAIRKLIHLSYSVLLDEMKLAEQTYREMQKVFQQFSPYHRTFLKAIIRKVEAGETGIEPEILKLLQKQAQDGDDTNEEAKG